MRALATIRRIASIEDVPNSDHLCLLKIDKWQVIARKGTFEIGVLCVFFEPNSLLPQCDEFAFLGTLVHTPVGTGYRVRSVRIRGVVSDGLAMPFHALPSLAKLSHQLHKDTDLTQRLGVKLYEPIPKKTNTLSMPKYNHLPFPAFLVKSTLPNVDKLSSQGDVEPGRVTWELTQRLAGGQMTIWGNSNVHHRYKPDFKNILHKFGWHICEQAISIFKGTPYFGVASRRFGFVADADNPYWAAAIRLGVEQILIEENLALLGQLVPVDPHSTPAYTYSPKHQFHLSGIFDIDKRKQFTTDEVSDWLSAHHLGERILRVPVIKSAFEFPPDNITPALHRIVQEWASVIGAPVLGVNGRANKGFGSFKYINPDTES